MSKILNMSHDTVPDSNHTISCGNSPTSAQLFEATTTGDIILFSFAFGISGLTTAIFINEVYRIITSKLHFRNKRRIFWLLGIYPFFSLSSCLLLVIPRTQRIVDLSNSVYFGICIVKFWNLIVAYYGGAKRMCAFAQQNDLYFNLRSPPLCCCCCWCPSVPVTTRNMNLIHMLLIQFALVPIVAELGLYITVINGDANLLISEKESKSSFTIVSVARSVSASAAFWGLILIFRMSRQTLSKQRITLKFACMKLAILFSHVQIGILSFFASLDFIECTPLFSGVSKSYWINSAILPFEMFLLMIMARRAYANDGVREKSLLETTNNLFESAYEGQEASPFSESMESQVKNTCETHNSTHKYGSMIIKKETNMS